MVKLLDCTLRDGGYINDWNFGYNSMLDIVKKLEETNVDVVELGFIKNESYNKDRAVFNDVSQINALIPNKNPNINYAAMIEVFNPIPIEKLSKRNDKTIDTIRVIIWKTRHDENNNEFDALQEGFEYCKGIVERGYNLCVQPARVDQYNDEEFVNMVRKFEKLSPLAIYVVDSWGTRQIEDVIHYAKLANENMSDGIAIGYHGHNNMLQAFGIATTFVHENFNRDLYVDGSIYGIGRCAGNLNIETFAEYLNDINSKNYNLTPMYYIYDKYIKEIYNKHKWGYSIYYFLTAVYNAHPNYAWYLGHEKGINPIIFEKVLKTIPSIDRVLYNKEKANKYLSMIFDEVK